jgi:phytoene dehydrogenase-like protein
MTTKTYEFCCGDGSKTLTAVAYPAAAGHSVALLEQRGWVGGGCITREVTVPGFKHDLHTTKVFLVKANFLGHCHELGLLSKVGLKYVETDDPYHDSLSQDGSGIRVFTDLERVREALTSINADDAAEYRIFTSHAMTFVELMSWGMLSPPPNRATFPEVLNQSSDSRS